MHTRVFIFHQQLSLKSEENSLQYNSCRKIDKFYIANNEWLNTVFEMPQLKPQTSNDLNATKLGHPRKTFTESCERSKRQKMNDFITSSNITSSEIMYASNKKLQQSGERSVIQLFKNVTSSPKDI